jgi:UDP-2,3-diacylglucosamine pyrophosphatase LpxH
MRQLVHIISDLHLGGVAATDTTPAFQMCPASTHDVLATFIKKLQSGGDALESHLVIAGDIVDFLAEAPFAPFTGDPAAACAKLERIFDSSQVVWDALAEFAAKPYNFLTLMLGNHDIELSLPGVRQMLYDRLPGPHVRFIYDNEAFTLGPLLVEHGNRFDAWNAVPHGALRRVRSQLSRNGKVMPEFPAPPGSRMVIDVINPLKQQYPFIDLLKPETAAALPVAAALGAIGLQKVWDGFRQYCASRAVDYDEESGAPVADNYISAGPDHDAAVWQQAQRIALGGSTQEISAVGDMLGRGLAQVSEKTRAARIDAVFAAFRSLARMKRMHQEAFDVENEDELYLKPAIRAAEGGFKIIVYGHTHLPKKVSIGQGATYLNTGTWADVMCTPEGVWAADEEEGRRLFRAFAADLSANNLARWRRSIPTYARIAIDHGTFTEPELCFADDGTPVTSASLKRRLAGMPAA